MLHTTVNFRNLIRGLFFAFVILYEQPRHRGAERGLAGLQCELDLVARFLFLARSCQLEHAIYSIPKLREGLIQESALVQGARGGRKSFFQFQGGIQIFANTLKLSAPRGERVRFTCIEHVAHGEAQGIQIILHAEKLQRIAAIAVH